MQREYNYEDVYMKPQKCVVNSRSECDIGVTFGPKRFRNPVVAANMKSVVDYDTCRYLASKGMFYILHRFHLDHNELIHFVREMNEAHGFASISIGIRDEDLNLLQVLLNSGAYPTYVTIDVAHAHSQRTFDMIKQVKAILPDCFLIVGNVATGEAVDDLRRVRDPDGNRLVDAIKVFIAPGLACTTKVKTGFTRGTVTCLKECLDAACDIPLIADGGVREPGHIALAMACGASMVMVGSYLCGFDQNPGDVVEINGHKKYIYYGSASFNNKRSKKHVEGKEIILDYKGNMDDRIYDIECSLRSAVSYAGVDNIMDMYGTPLFYM
jgi:GMP reductase